MQFLEQIGQPIAFDTVLQFLLYDMQAILSQLLHCKGLLSQLKHFVITHPSKEFRPWKIIIAENKSVLSN